MMRKFLPSLKSVVLLSTLASTAIFSLPNASALDAAGEGRRAWLQYNCYGCHGMRAGGGMGPNVVHETGELQSAVMHGAGGGMPAFSLIMTDTDIANLTAYLNSIDTAAEPTFLHWWEPVPSQ